MNILKTYKKDIFYIAIVVILLFITWHNINNTNKMNKKFDRYENTIIALNDSIKHNVVNGIDIYSKKAPEIYLNELINSEYFKSLSKDQQQYYNELTKIKGLYHLVKPTTKTR